MRKEILRLNNVTLEENGERYLDNLNLYILQGEIMGLIVSDAKGSTQLIHLICHNIPISFGGVYYEDKRVNHYSYSDFTDNRVYVIEERGRLIDSLTISDNLFVMRKGFKKYIINSKVLDSQAERLMAEIGFSIDPRRRADSMTAFERCVTELLKAILSGCKLIILDRISNFPKPDGIKAVPGHHTGTGETGDRFFVSGEPPSGGIPDREPCGIVSPGNDMEGV
ncbi:MAG: ATP-binding cassette domain-containing protein [Lacrimispora sp.]